MTARAIGFLCMTLLAPAAVPGQTWKLIGPPGGAVRTLYADVSHPQRVYLGTDDGHVFGSEDAGEHWTLLGRAGSRSDSVVAAIAGDPQDPRKLFAATWTLDPTAGGGMFESNDGGLTWRMAGLAGHAVRALAVTPSNPDVLAAGAFDGVYLSRDGGDSWERISPAGDAELRALDSLAFDPRDPLTLYAGTYHLPWKTSDGGKSWRPIHDGMIDDSDVMSLLPVGADPGRILASACSGIYRSDNGGALWHKIQGIPYAARRTLALVQAPGHSNVLYAATTEGLWKTGDGGDTWRLLTPQNWVVNGVATLGSNSSRVVIGTEQFGVQASDDGGAHFHDANSGFFHRGMLALAVDPAYAQRMLAVPAQAPEQALESEDDGKTWKMLGPGIRAESIRGIYAAPNGWWVAMQEGGWKRYDTARARWVPAGAAGPAGRGLEAPGKRGLSDNRGARSGLEQRGAPVVNDMVFGRQCWFAATENGLLASSNRGATWAIAPLPGWPDSPAFSVRASDDGARLWVTSLDGLAYSADSGRTWRLRQLPFAVTHPLVFGVADPASGSTLVAGGSKGLFISRNAGETWALAGAGLPATPILAFTISGNLFFASMQTGGLFFSRDEGRTWTRIPGEFADLRFASLSPGGDPGSVIARSAPDELFELSAGAGNSTEGYAAKGIRSAEPVLARIPCRCAISKHGPFPELHRTVPKGVGRALSK